ncbi:uncharacterized protein F4822DRAFT_427312 [Hypoxylon trugodes]|uniref:uncharacterized protein n=1 Tax=Hypoxylon trugodes TaxID=326681 RepID=UPI002199A6FC|nr:uncharacterized protein F4822DRAFT_427312 [Hypoxylon trugodes]KAI1391462.1 hypothetical protein F4822DRAFT_427312 [Hypoxylon trugodes]
MPLFPVSPNIQELESTSRKRTHEEFTEDSIKVATDDPSDTENLEGQKTVAMSASAINSQPQITMDSTPASSPSELTEPGSSPPIEVTPSPNKTPEPSTTTSKPSQPQSSSTPAAQNRQPAKRKTTAEKEQERAEKRQKKDAEAAEKAQKKAQEEAEKTEKAKKKAAEEAVKAAKLAEKEAKKRKKEEDELATKRKQERQQSMLASFVKRAPSTPLKKPILLVADDSSPKPITAAITPQKDSKPEKSAYDRAFQPFFVKSGVTLAPQPFEMDEQTRDAKSDILDQYIRGERGEFNPRPFNPLEAFNLAFPQKRGIMPASVKKIMESIHGDPLENPFGTTERTESQTEKLATNAQDRLNSITMKYLSFYQDVRPPYYGTITTPITTQKLRSLSRKPMGRIVQQLNYDYDSEAEWVEDDGEDLDDEEDDEEDHEGEEEMDDFLDDSEDLPAMTRPTFLGEKEPCGTGICFEDQTRLGPSATVYKYRLEFMLDTLEHHSGIDPFSTAYWPAPPKKVAATKNTAGTAPTASTSMPPPPGVPSDAFSMLAAGNSASPAVDIKELVPKDVFDDFKRAIISEEFRDHTKGTIVDLLAKKFSTCTKAQVKTTLDKVAHRINVPGEKKSVKHWALLPAFAL